MTAFNIVRFRIKPGREDEFLAAHKAVARGFPGFRRFVMVKTGERAYCVMGEWASFDKIVAARPGMIGLLDSFRDCLEDLGGGLGVTDPVAGTMVMEMRPAPKRKAAARKAKKAAKKSAKKTAKARKPAKKKPAKKKKAGRRR